MHRTNPATTCPQTNRGVTAKLIILEEAGKWTLSFDRYAPASKCQLTTRLAAALDGKFITTVVLPTLTISDTALIAISTIQGEGNHFNRFLNTTDSAGRPVFRSLEFFNSCQACRDADIADACCHMRDAIPHWQSGRRHKRLESMMKNEKELYLQEIKGVQSGADSIAFKKHMVELMFERTPGPIELHPNIDAVYIGIDPCGVGNSRFGIVSFYYSPTGVVIVGLDAVPVKRDEKDIEGPLKEHVSRLRRLPKLQNARLVFLIENNLGMEAPRLSNFILHNPSVFHNSIVPCEKGDVVGFRTTNNVKESMYTTLRDAILSQSIVFYAGPGAVTVSFNSFNEARSELRKEVEGYRVITEYDCEKPFSKPKRTYTGKASYGNDDILLALMIGLLWSRVHRSRNQPSLTA